MTEKKRRFNDLTETKGTFSLVESELIDPFCLVIMKNIHPTSLIFIGIIGFFLIIFAMILPAIGLIKSIDAIGIASIGFLSLGICLCGSDPELKKKYGV